MADKITVFWFRRDLRLEDNAGLYYALQSDYPVLPVFIFDPEILEELPEDDARVNFIFEQVQAIRKELQGHGSSLAIYYAEPVDVFKTLSRDYKIEQLFFNGDYEPYAKNRDNAVKEYLNSLDAEVNSFKDQVIFEKSEVAKEDGDPYVVYTPYMKTWRGKFNKKEHLKDYTSSDYFENLYQNERLPTLSLGDLGFKKSKIKVPEYNIESSLVDDYQEKRNFPAEDRTSPLGPHLRFGTLSIRKAVKAALQSNDDTFLKELIWREFFMQILYHFPETVNNAFKKKYDRIKWANNEAYFERWKSGTTGYPLVDAGMRQLKATGYMHNRVRMVVAGFLCKHLLIDWRWGEAYFALKLLDYEQASNVGNWQWAAGSGVDAAPYFRIFNPTTQFEKFDKNHAYVEKWVEEYGTKDYPEKIVNHKEARELALETYKNAIN